MSRRRVIELAMEYKRGDSILNFGKSSGRIAAFLAGYDRAIEEVLKLVDIYAANSGKVRLTDKIKSLKEKI